MILALKMNINQQGSRLIGQIESNHSFYFDTVRFRAHDVPGISQRRFDSTVFPTYRRRDDVPNRRRLQLGRLLEHGGGLGPGRAVDGAHLAGRKGGQGVLRHAGDDGVAIVSIAAAHAEEDALLGAGLGGAIARAAAPARVLGGHRCSLFC